MAGSELLRILLLHERGNQFVTANEHAGKAVAKSTRNLWG